MIKLTKKSAWLLLSLIVLTLAGCSAKVGLGHPPGMRGAGPGPGPVTSARASSSVRATVLLTLPPQEMNKGECTIFLWAKQDNRPLVFTQNIATDQAKVLVSGQALIMKRDQASEAVLPGFYARQHYVGNNVILDIRLVPDEGRNLYEGIKIPNGIMTVKNADKSETIISVSGLLGCNLEN